MPENTLARQDGWTGDRIGDSTPRKRRYDTGIMIPDYQHDLLRDLGRQGGMAKTLFAWFLALGLADPMRPRIHHNGIDYHRPISTHNTNRIIGRLFEKELIRYDDGWLYLSATGHKFYGLPYKEHPPTQRRHLHYINLFWLFMETKWGADFVLEMGHREIHSWWQSLSADDKAVTRKPDSFYSLHHTYSALEVEVSWKAKEDIKSWMSKLWLEAATPSAPLKKVKVLYDNDNKNRVYHAAADYLAAGTYFELQDVDDYALPNVRP